MKIKQYLTSQAARAAVAAELAKPIAKRISAWRRGIREYARELSRDAAEMDCPTAQTVKKMLLNGAGSWKEFSAGGSSLVYDADIAERLCNPSELKRLKGGALPPSTCNDWIEAQALALWQAYKLILRAISALDV